jgi:hypothetical protein
MRKTTLVGVGGFPPHRAAEDLILIARLVEAGARIKYAPGALVSWQIAGTLGETYARFANYSHHNLIAGWGRYWHRGVTRLYACFAAVVVAVYLAGGGAWGLLGWPPFLLARATKAAWVKRRSFAFKTLHPGRIVMAAGILSVIDIATFAGVVRWLRRDPAPR